MTKEETRKRAEEIAQRFIGSGDNVLHCISSCRDAIVAFAEEVRGEQGEWQQIDRDMAFYAFRYCLGRQTYAVNDCVNYLIANWRQFLTIEQIQIQNEIRKHFKRVGKPVEPEWERVLAIRNEVENQ